MSTVKVLRLDEYRDRRVDRLRLAESLYRADSGRHALLLHLSEVARLSGADRAAVVWVDEYGSGLIHPHVVLDLLSDRPRRSFTTEPLHRAWELGVPGAYDSGSDPIPCIAPTFAIALGSDGTRAWFLVTESVGPRGALDEEARDSVMFLAGECSAVVLHRDLDLTRDDAGGATAQAGSGFAGWRVLQDIEGRESDDEESRRIALRFMVARLARLLVEDDLSVSAERITEQVRMARVQLVAHPKIVDEEARLWEVVLEAMDEGRIEDLAVALVELGDVVEARAHYHGALELYECAYAIGASTGAAVPAVDAARFRGRLLRRRAQWSESEHWYGVAQQVAEAAGLDDRLALVLVGLAVIKKEVGNLPAAREGLRKALKVAERSGDRDAIAGVHLDLLGLEHTAGNLPLGLAHGWIAVSTYQDNSAGRVRSLASLAGALVDHGDREAAEDAWALVAQEARDNYYRIYAYDALAYLAALRGDVDAFERNASVCDTLGWEHGPHSAKAEVLYYRGMSYRAMGRYEPARQWLTRAVTFAEEHDFNRVMFEAESALDDLNTSRQEQKMQPAAAPLEVKQGLREMRQGLAGVGV
jgi:tetratricopeptide (TPR) repeat protein